MLNLIRHIKMKFQIRFLLWALRDKSDWRILRIKQAVEMLDTSDINSLRVFPKQVLQILELFNEGEVSE